MSNVRIEATIKDLKKWADEALEEHRYLEVEGYKMAINSIEVRDLIISRLKDRVKNLEQKQKQHETDLLNKIAKPIATRFFYWWHNQPGSNTESGFDDWWVSKEARSIVSEITDRKEAKS